jgi:hypothetical protein
MRFAPLLGLTLAAGCAGAQGASVPVSAAPQTVVSTPGSTGAVTLTRENALMSADVASDPGRVWPLVAQAYADIGIPIDQLDQNTHIATATNQRVRRLMGKGLGTYFTCAGPFGNTANRDDVYVTIRTQVFPGQGQGSIVRIGAHAVSKSGTAANTITDCASNGELEKLIIQKIMEHAAG